MRGKVNDRMKSPLVGKACKGCAAIAVRMKHGRLLSALAKPFDQWCDCGLSCAHGRNANRGYRRVGIVCACAAAKADGHGGRVVQNLAQSGVESADIGQSWH